MEKYAPAPNANKAGKLEKSSELIKTVVNDHNKQDFMLIIAVLIAFVQPFWLCVWPRNEKERRKKTPNIIVWISLHQPESWLCVFLFVLYGCVCVYRKSSTIIIQQLFVQFISFVLNLWISFRRVSKESAWGSLKKYQIKSIQNIHGRVFGISLIHKKFNYDKRFRWMFSY